jgi:hypothetical protein
MGLSTNNFGQLKTPAAGRREPSTTPMAADRNSPLSAAAFSTWLVEDSVLMDRICRRMEVRLSRGQKLNRVVKLFARRWNGKAYKANQGRKIHLSQSSLIRRFYKWRAHGRRAESVQLGYARANRPTPAHDRLVQVAEAAANPGISSFKSAVQAIPDRTVGVDSFYRAIPPDGRAVLRKVFKARREAKAMERELARWVAAVGAQNVQ